MKREALSNKIFILGVDGLDPSLARKYVDAGKMPNLAQFIDRGAARQDLMLLGAVPTITPPLWTTLATGAYPMTHGITCFSASPTLLWMKSATTCFLPIVKPNNCGTSLRKQAKKHWYGIGLVPPGRQVQIAPIFMLLMAPVQAAST